jgi:hypothetical protein
MLATQRTNGTGGGAWPPAPDRHPDQPSISGKPGPENEPTVAINEPGAYIQAEPVPLPGASSADNPEAVIVSKRRGAEQEAMTAWLDQNPLRRWRLKQPPEGWKRSVLARQLGVSHTAVAAWETGNRLPLVDAMAKIEALTGISATRWMQWYEQRPAQE